MAVEKMTFCGRAFAKEIEFYWGFQEWIEVAKWTKKDQGAFQAEGIITSLHVECSLNLSTQHLKNFLFLSSIKFIGWLFCVSKKYFLFVVSFVNLSVIHTKIPKKENIFRSKFSELTMQNLSLEVFQRHISGRKSCMKSFLDSLLQPEKIHFKLVLILRFFT